MSQGQELSLTTVALPQSVSSKLDDFPRFTPVANVTAVEYNSAIAGHLPYSSFNYVALRCFFPEAQAARIGDGVALILNDPGNGTSFLTLLSRNYIDSFPGGVLSNLIDYARDQGLDSVLRNVSECSLASLPEGIQISERSDSFDYILSIEGMLNPSSPEILKKHQLVNDYRTANPETMIRKMDFHDPEIRSTLEEVDSAWQASRNGDGLGTRAWERNAFLRSLQHHQDFNLNLLVAEGEDRIPLGFFSYEELSNGYCLPHFSKTLAGQGGLFEFLFLECAKCMLAKGCLWMNYEEDLGNPGLRRMKRSWSSCRMLRVYDVRIKG